MSSDCKDFLSRCLDKNPETRLGASNDATELLEHPWLRELSVQSLLNKEYETPFVPNLSEDESAHFDNNLGDEEEPLSPEPKKRISTESQ